MESSGKVVNAETVDWSSTANLEPVPDKPVLYDRDAPISDVNESKSEGNCEAVVMGDKADVADATVAVSSILTGETTGYWPGPLCRPLK